jgi:hypothetical protein
VYVTITAYRAVKGFVLSDLMKYVTGVVDRAGNTLPDTFDSDTLTSWTGSVGQDVLRELSEWQPKLAVVIQMPKRSRRRGQR